MCETKNLKAHTHIVQRYVTKSFCSNFDLKPPPATSALFDKRAMTAPEQMKMDEYKLGGILGPHDALLVKQTMRGCFQECLGCDAKSEFKISPFSTDQITGFRVSEQAMAVPDILYAIFFVFS